MNPNKLTDEQIAARPELFMGAIVYMPTEDGTLGNWFRVDNAGQLSDYTFFKGCRFLLFPGEPGCPWPPPSEFKHEWKEGDKAWVHWRGYWYKCDTIFDISGHYSFRCSSNCTTLEFAPYAPAIYIPEEK